MTDHQLAVAAFLAVFGNAVHYGVDILLQSEWMALNKTNLRHSASYLHSGLHFVALLFLFPYNVAFVVAALHLLIDTRQPLIWWGQVIRVPRKDGPINLHVAFWRDQTLHILIIAPAALYQAHRS